MLPSHESFADDFAFLADHVKTIELQNREGAVVAVVPAWQGRTMTSAVSRNGPGFGWLNRRFIASGRRDPQANLYGGEDRLWIAPEGGPFSFFFAPNTSFEFANWRCPPVIDTEGFDLVHQTATSVTCSRDAVVSNYSNTEFALRFERTVSILDRELVERVLEVEIAPSISFVAHQSENRLTNAGDVPWTGERGLPALWILGMFRPTPSVTMVVPYQGGSEAADGPIVTRDYFGALDESRLRIDKARRLIFFRGDGAFRSKIGLPFSRCTPILGSWDQQGGSLTIVQFNRPDQVTNGFVNNLWRLDTDRFSGDAINAYNDGPNESGECLGPFYELETLSPALALSPGQTYAHFHRTLHLTGDAPALANLTAKLFGTDLKQIASQFDSN